jgi:hypothetical protein
MSYRPTASTPRNVFGTLLNPIPTDRTPIMMNGTGLRQFMTDMPLCGRPRKPRPLNSSIILHTSRIMQDSCWPSGKDAVLPIVLDVTNVDIKVSSAHFFFYLEMMQLRWRVLFGLPDEETSIYIPFMPNWSLFFPIILFNNCATASANIAVCRTSKSWLRPWHHNKTAQEESCKFLFSLIVVKKWWYDNQKTSICPSYFGSEDENGPVWSSILLEALSTTLWTLTNMVQQALHFPNANFLGFLRAWAWTCTSW